MFQSRTEQKALSAIWPGLRACVTWMMSMGAFAGLMWLAAQLPKKAVPVAAPQELKRAELPDSEEECPKPPEEEEGFRCFQQMIPPKFISGEKPRYTPEALKARVQGLMIAKCIISCRGEVKQCRIIKGLPHMNEAVLAALQTRRYQPTLNGGRAVSVSYHFNIKLELPK